MDFSNTEQQECVIKIIIGFDPSRRLDLYTKKNDDRAILDCIGASSWDTEFLIKIICYLPKENRYEAISGRIAGWVCDAKEKNVLLKSLLKIIEESEHLNIFIEALTAPLKKGSLQIFLDIRQHLGLDKWFELLSKKNQSNQNLLHVIASSTNDNISLDEFCGALLGDLSIDQKISLLLSRDSTGKTPLHIALVHFKTERRCFEYKTFLDVSLIQWGFIRKLLSSIPGNDRQHLFEMRDAELNSPLAENKYRISEIFEILQEIMPLLPDAAHIYIATNINDKSGRSILDRQLSDFWELSSRRMSYYPPEKTDLIKFFTLLNADTALKLIGICIKKGGDPQLIMKAIACQRKCDAIFLQQIAIITCILCDHKSKSARSNFVFFNWLYSSSDLKFIEEFMNLESLEKCQRMVINYLDSDGSTEIGKEILDKLKVSDLESLKISWNKTDGLKFEV